MRLEKLTPQEVNTYFKSKNTVIIPTGSIECHGTHNVLGVDTLAVEKLADMISKKSHTLIATTIPYGACDNLSEYPGTISIGHDLFCQIVERVVNEFIKHGAERFVFLNGHGGNIPALNQVCLNLYNKGKLGAIMNWWLMSWELNPEWKGGHGGAQETSAMLAIDPSLVKMDLIEEMGLINDIKSFETVGFTNVSFKGVTIPVPRPTSAYAKNGWIGPDHPKNANIKWGTEMLEACANYICEFIEQF
ncbi:MAG: creatininase family protein [Defluviitaleaceae bacterium]|nr:creatininase family protein [Defluviitaleaceae bacterium]